MLQNSIGTNARQSVPRSAQLAGLGKRSGSGTNGVARRGREDAPPCERWPRPVTRGHLLQESDSQVSSPL